MLTQLRAADVTANDIPSKPSIESPNSIDDHPPAAAAEKGTLGLPDGHGVLVSPAEAVPHAPPAAPHPRPAKRRITWLVRIQLKYKTSSHEPTNETRRKRRRSFPAQERFIQDARMAREMDRL